MKHSIGLIAMIAGILFAQTLKAQDSTATGNKNKKKHGASISLGPKGLQVIPGGGEKEKQEKKQNESDVDSTEHDSDDTGFSSHWVMMDLGFNIIQDNTNYNSPGAKALLNVPVANRNSSLFNLRSSKSINVNIYPFMETFEVMNRRKQKINITTGIGLQLYNFRFESPISFTRNTGVVSLDSTSLKKNKLGFDFLNVPLMFTFKTLLYKKTYLVYGVGITGGYNIATWTKQESSQYGKVKAHDNFDFATFNSCITGEIGFSKNNNGGVRLYGSYQLTNLYKDGLDQHPIAIGVRFFGI